MKTNQLSINALVAAIYVVLTVVLFPNLSYGMIQFRVAEILLILILFNRKYVLGIVLGTFIANLFSPLGIIDWVVGTGATIVSLYLMDRFKNKTMLSLIMPAIVNGLIVGVQLNLIFDLPLLASIGSVFVGEFVVVSIAGGILYGLLKQNSFFIRLIS